MVTGDNPLTAKYIAEKAGVDDFIAEAKPEDKWNISRRNNSPANVVDNDGGTVRMMLPLWLRRMSE